ncbi:hypothetical protein HMPREF1152_0635 [Mogibacterium sp. CM50]|nr:hypothetical protein HMPREF1152_0635 [Mogibacterium sp. CM50]
MDKSVVAVTKYFQRDKRTSSISTEGYVAVLRELHKAPESYSYLN